MLDVWGSIELQDLGREGYRRFGVPVGGAFDLEAHLMANSLVENAGTCSTLELAMAQVVLSASDDTTVALAGAQSQVSVDDVPVQRSRFPVHSGQVLRIEPPQQGARTYLAIRGGFDGQFVLGSRSGTRIKRGDQLVCAQEPESHSKPIAHDQRDELEICPGPWAELIKPEDLTHRVFRASTKMNRVGIRVEGAISDRHREITSEPACFGGIQLTPSGELIILGPDGPTIGGYPIIAVVKPSSRSTLAQLRPGDPIQFLY